MSIFRPAAVAAAVALSVVAVGAAEAQTATGTVSYEVQAIDEISVTGTHVLVVNTATAGSQPTPASSTGSWAVTSNQTNMKVTAQLSAAMPTGVTLTTNLTAPTGGTSAGAVALTTLAQNVVTGIGAVAESGLGLTYGLSATVAAGKVPATNVTVTYTLTTGI